ncbi:hypothetical protein B7P43_G06748 [Cryptotermes secundus]|uniref:Ig-like domain-containing protein n=1 Tax=Cryptotermes secundus TaxID=105785 RepID=A0A2J7RIE5_9NEOP|nr:hypothetical protein B7P43_G06748 [Cryptotermes secundus]
MLLQVSWVRHRDIHLLTVGRYTYTSDQRFRAIHHPHSEDWTLQIKYPQHRDSGIYECQISTTPHMSHFIHLNVVGILFESRLVTEYFKGGVFLCIDPLLGNDSVEALRRADHPPKESYRMCKI